MAKLSDSLFIAVGGHVAAIDPATGQELWRTKLKASSISTVAVVNGALYGAAGGELFRLEPATGEILWRNKLKGLGMGVVAFPGDTVPAAAAEKRRAAAGAG